MISYHEALDPHPALRHSVTTCTRSWSTTTVHRDANMGAKLCDTCRILEDIDALSTEVSSYLFSFTDSWPALSNLSLSARSGCGFCRLLKDTLRTNQRLDDVKEQQVKIHVFPHIASARWGGITDGEEAGISEKWNILAGLKVRVIEVESKAEKHRFNFLMGFDDDQFSLPTTPLGEKYQRKGFFAITTTHR